MTHPYWERLWIAEHEASHAIGAQAMGLRVPWVSIDKVAEVEDLHLAATGIEIDGHEDDEHKLAVNVTIKDRSDLLGVCVSMAMASFVSPPGTWIDSYSVDELRQAIEMAEAGGISGEEITSRCEMIMDERWGDIVALAQRLVTEGRVEFSSV